MKDDLKKNKKWKTTLKKIKNGRQPQINMEDDPPKKVEDNLNNLIFFKLKTT
jgi:hypothetical protein